MFGSICYNVDDLWFWIPSVIGGGVNACGAFVACSLRWKIMHTGSDGSLLLLLILFSSRLSRSSSSFTR